jgi:hypothetical protein
MQQLFKVHSGHHAQNVISLNYQSPGAGGDVVW